MKMIQKRHPLKLSCIVVNYNRADLTVTCIKKLVRSLQNLSYEIIIIDNGSANSSVEKIKAAFPNIFIIEENIIHLHRDNSNYIILVKLKRNYGFAKANNIGISIARGEYILLINNDAYITKATLNELINFMDKKPKAGMVGPKVIWPDGTSQYTAGKSYNFFILLGRVLKIGSIVRWCNKYIWTKLLQSNKNNKNLSFINAKQVEVVSGVCVLVRKEVFLQTGGFDEKFFMYLEDIDWADRVREKGWEIWYLPYVNVVHLGGASSGGMFRDLRWEAYKALLYYFFKRKGKKGLFLAKLIISTGMIIRIFFCLFYCLAKPSNIFRCKQLLKILKQILKCKVKK